MVPHTGHWPSHGSSTRPATKESDGVPQASASMAIDTHAKLLAMSRLLLLPAALLVACTPEALPQSPQIHLDRPAVEFGANYVGTQPQESLLIENRGQDPLVLQPPVLSGDPAFTVDGPLKTELLSREHT